MSEWGDRSCAGRNRNHTNVSHMLEFRFLTTGLTWDSQDLRNKEFRECMAKECYWWTKYSYLAGISTEYLHVCYLQIHMFNKCPSEWTNFANEEKEKRADELAKWVKSEYLTLALKTWVLSLGPTPTSFPLTFMWA